MVKISRDTGPFVGPGKQVDTRPVRKTRDPAMRRCASQLNTSGQVVERYRSTTLDSAILRRTTVMCALRDGLLRLVIHEYQSDSSSIMLSSPASLVPRMARPPPRTLKVLRLDRGSLHISRLLKNVGPSPDERDLVRCEEKDRRQYRVLSRTSDDDADDRIPPSRRRETFSATC